MSLSEKIAPVIEALPKFHKLFDEIEADLRAASEKASLLDVNIAQLNKVTGEVYTVTEELNRLRAQRAEMEAAIATLRKLPVFSG